MNAAQIHLLFNHWPVIGTMLGLILLLAGKFFPASQSFRAGLITIILAAILAIPTLLSGEGAEKIVEKQGISHDVIHEHEEAAEKGFWAMEALGILALLALISDVRTGKSGVLGNVVIIAALVLSVMLTYVSHTGGLIKHPELSGDARTIPIQGEEEVDED